MAIAAHQSEPEFVTVTTHIPTEVVPDLERLAARWGRSVDHTVATAILRLIDQEAENQVFLPLHPELEAWIEEGERSALEEPTYSTEEVRAHLDQGVASARR